MELTAVALVKRDAAHAGHESGGGEGQQVLRQRIVDLEARVDALELDRTLKRSAATTTSAVRGALARLSEAPTNWHQATAYLVGPPVAADAGGESDRMTLGARLGMVAASAAMVLFQALVAVAVFWGVFIPSCSDNTSCNYGTYCPVGAAWECQNCGYLNPLMAEPPPPDYDPSRYRGLALRWGGDVNYTLVRSICAAPTDLEVFNTWGCGGERTRLSRDAVLNWCENCVRPASGNVTLGPPSFSASKLVIGDWAAMALCTTMLAMQLVGEIKDMELCRRALARGRRENDKGCSLPMFSGREDMPNPPSEIGVSRNF